MKHVIWAVALVLFSTGTFYFGAGFGAQQTANHIEASCLDDNAAQTPINNHAYFCMDYTRFQQQMQALRGDRAA